MTETKQRGKLRNEWNKMAVNGEVKTLETFADAPVREVPLRKEKSKDK